MNIEMILKIKERSIILEKEFDDGKNEYAKALEEKLMNFGSESFDSFDRDVKISKAKENIDIIGGRILEMNEILSILYEGMDNDSKSK